MEKTILWSEGIGNIDLPWDSGASFTKLTCVSDVALGVFSYEIKTILCSNAIVFTIECQAWITMADIQQKY
jgi:hypothetical protein